MSNISNFFSPGKKERREFITGPSTRTWPVPPGVSEIEIHVWGGGGEGALNGGGGGGGGYSRARLSVTPTDSLSITVGGNAEPSYVSIPTQSPVSPIHAGAGCPGTAGSNGAAAGGAGGVGISTLAPTQPQVYCFSATGGTGGSGYYSPTPASATGGGGASAGSPHGNGKNGATATSVNYTTPGANILKAGRGSYRSMALQYLYDVSCELAGAEENKGLYDTNWFHVEDNIAGPGGAGGVTFDYRNGPTTIAGSCYHGQDGGFLAGGGGGQYCASPGRCALGGRGGIAGGGGAPGGIPGSTCGGSGAVIIYY